MNTSCHMHIWQSRQVLSNITEKKCFLKPPTKNKVYLHLALFDGMHQQ